MQKLLKMKAYKGFNRNEDGTLSCQGFVYEPGKTYKHEGKIKLCKSGFHACHELWQTWFFYPNNVKNTFYEVEYGGDIIDNDDKDGKFVCSEIRLVKEIDMTDVARFDNAGYFSEGFASVILNWKYNFINTEGKLLSEQWFDNAFYFSDGFALVKLDGKWNFINTKGKLLSKRWFDEALDFSGGYATILQDEKWNFIDTEGNLLSEQWFDDAGSFLEGFADVKIDGRWLKINPKGEFVEK